MAAAVLGLSLEAMAAAPALEPTSPPNSNSPVAPLILSGRQSARPPGTYSAGIADLIAMLDAKVSAGVILEYIQNSTTAYDPEATELIVLKEHGASMEVLMALLHHGDELRLRIAQALSTLSPPSSALASDELTEAAAPGYPAGSPAFEGELSPAMEEPYPVTVYGFAYRWPWLCRAPVCNSYEPYHYERGCWLPRHDSGSPAPDSGSLVTEVGSRERAVPAPPASRPWHSVSAPNSGHTSAPTAHSGGGRASSGRPVARAAGRSR